MQSEVRSGPYSFVFHVQRLIKGVVHKIRNATSEDVNGAAALVESRYVFRERNIMGWRAMG